MYYREYFYYLKKKLPDKCILILEEIYSEAKKVIESNYKIIKEAERHDEIVLDKIVLPEMNRKYPMAYEILIREDLIKKDGENMVLTKFGIYLLHYMYE